VQVNAITFTCRVMQVMVAVLIHLQDEHCTAESHIFSQYVRTPHHKPHDMKVPFTVCFNYSRLHYRSVSSQKLIESPAFSRFDGPFFKVPLLGQRWGTVCVNSFGNRTSPSDNLNDRLKCLCLGSTAAAPCG